MRLKSKTLKEKFVFFQLVFPTTFCTTQLLFVTCNSKVGDITEKVFALDKSSCKFQLQKTRQKKKK